MLKNNTTSSIDYTLPTTSSTTPTPPQDVVLETQGTPYNLVGGERVMTILINEMRELKAKVYELETKKIIDETQFPAEVLLANNIIVPPSRKNKNGKGYRPLLKSEIEDSQKDGANMAMAARRLGTTFETYKKYAKLYGLWNPQPCIRGKRNLFNSERGRYPLSKILNGDFNGHPAVTDWLVKDKLLRSGTKPLSCEHCGLSERRTGDLKIPLLLNHMDGDRKNFKLDNLKLFCLNCTFYVGRGFIRSGKFTLDPDWIQGMRAEEMDEDARY